ncbi:MULTISPECIES: DMT family transporter [Pseudoxanthomonas]|uniref:Drug/metabolite transporter (DMT)-like permease n=1 Tax=Pseudoxanthomonas winnipegensis TaxID=2480810 RepID=A0AAW8GFN9_9GAMM|nr:MULTISPECIES: DMT family transporter [Pseudoxanthomonas]MDQ1120428.1 drug/metabolite transporter (DMT)-like permease [Pseudoxanthomonas winnipegensis]MDQ1133647.1 drug/metabolite transporter (DMT)-like permease [Pseudoxanthomonas winnipegensis]MDR6140113.1 drug/metabolite transporter (DMT)-like permease [Pseudoxanthomonas sp. SORGH_AS_0997]
MASNEIRRGAAEMVVAMLMSGTIGWLVVSSQQSPTNVVFFRCLFGAATLIIVCAALGLLRRKAFSPRMLALVLFGGLAIVGNWLLLFAAYGRASISMATAVYNTQPFMLVGIGAIVFRERISASTLAWLALAFVGLVGVVRVPPAVLAVPGEYLHGIALALGAAFLYAVSSIVTKHLKGTPPHLLALLQLGVGIVLLAPFAQFDALPSSPRQWLDLVVLGVVNTGVMYVLLYGAIQKLPVAMTGALSFVYPVVAIAVDRIAFGQSLAWTQVLGALLILLAAAGVNFGWRLLPQRRNAHLAPGEPGASER